MFSKIVSSFAGASMLLTLLMLIGKGFGFFREIIFAGYFGSGKNFEIYLVGAVIPITINAIVFYIAQNFFIPVYNDFKTKDIQRAKELTVFYSWLFFLGGFVLTLILSTFSGPLVNIYLGNVSFAILNTTRLIYTIMLFTIPLNSAYSIVANYLNAEYKYFHPAISQLFLNISVILLIIFFYKIAGTIIIPIGILIGYLLQLLYVLYFSHLNFSFNFKSIKLLLAGSLKLKNSLFIIIVIEGISQLYSIVDRYYFNQMNPGGLASLNYAMNIFALPMSIISLALATVIFPKFSRSFSENNMPQFEAYYFRGVMINLIIFIPIVFLFLFDGQIIIKIIYERGKFNSVDTLMTFQILRIYSLSLIFYSIYAIINKIIYSLKEIKYLLIISIISLLLKVLISSVLVGKYHQDGLAMATTISYIVMSLLGFIIVKIKIKQKNTFILIKYLIYLCVIGALSLLLTNLLIGNSYLKLLVFSGVYIITVGYTWQVNLRYNIKKIIF
jgi:putative peptidoglycan lipid II flippase